MTVRKIGFVGFRTGMFAELRAIFEHGLGLRATDASPQQGGYDLAAATRLEAYDPSEPFHAFMTTGPVIGFEVDDFDEPRRRLAALGIVFLTGIQHAGGKQWVHFRLPDGTVAEIIGPR